jgi:TRAP-type C4-dicarboxylate transport system substrate-binding protein
MKSFSKITTLLVGIFLLGGAFLAQNLRAQEADGDTITLKLGTLAPEHSSWDNILQDMGNKWGLAGVKLKVFGNGVLGDEPDMVTKMRINQIQVGVITVVGLAKIDKAVEVLSIPMLYKDYAESDYVRAKLQPVLEKRLEAKGFKVLNWGEAGWVYFFGKTPILTPDDLKKMKLFIWGDDPDTMNIWQSAGFSPIPLTATDILPNLQTGMINCFDTTPIAALSFQWFALAKHMTTMKWCPLVGATVITTQAWNKIPEASRPAILKAAAVAGKAFRDDIRKNSDKAIDVMKEHGLEVHDITADQYAQWEKLFQSVYPQISGTLIPADIMDMAIKYRDEYRAKKAAEQ